MTHTTTTAIAQPADPTDDVPVHEAELTALLARQICHGVPHIDVLTALLRNAHALALTYPCCTESIARSALRLGGHLLILSTVRPANATTTH